MRERLAAELTTLKNDGELIGDAALQTDADAALGLLARAGTGDTAALQEAIRRSPRDVRPAPAPAPSDETIRLARDRGFAARRGTARHLPDRGRRGARRRSAPSAARLNAQADDREALTTVRRAFHTLKGSGRMVGLTELGEIAFEVEKVHNRLLEEDRPVTPPVLAMIEAALASFRVWVDTLHRKGRVAPDPKAVRAAIARVEAELRSRPGPRRRSACRPRCTALPSARCAQSAGRADDRSDRARRNVAAGSDAGCRSVCSVAARRGDRIRARGRVALRARHLQPTPRRHPLRRSPRR